MISVSGEQRHLQSYSAGKGKPGQEQHDYWMMISISSQQRHRQ